MTDVTADETAGMYAGEPAAEVSPEAELDAIDEQLIDRLARAPEQAGCNWPARAGCCRR